MSYHNQSFYIFENLTAIFIRTILIGNKKYSSWQGKCSEHFSEKGFAQLDVNHGSMPS